MCPRRSGCSRVEVSRSNPVRQLDIRECQGQISWLRHCQKSRRSVRAQSSFSEKEHAEITRGGHSQSRPEIRSSHRPQAGVRRRKRRGEAGGHQASRPCFAQRPDPQKRRRSPQEPPRNGRQVSSSQNKTGAQWRPFLHRGQLAAASLAIPLRWVIRRSAFGTLERLVLFRARILSTSALRNRWRCCNRGRSLRRS